MQFFNAWPLKVIMTLLVLNLVVVTWRRIPLTPPRYGVWCIHAGIITLICGLSMYYAQKLEGKIAIFKDPSLGPNIVDHFYDKDQRSLFVRYANAGLEDLIEIPLPTLPRFKEYGYRLNNSDALQRRGLSNIAVLADGTDPVTHKLRKENLAQSLGLKDQRLTFDVTGFFPYAQVATDFISDPSSTTSGVDVTRIRAGDAKPLNHWTLLSTDPQHNSLTERVPFELHHVDATAEMVEALTKAAGELFHLDVSLPNQQPIPLDVQIGKTYGLGKGGYSLSVVEFDPKFHPFDSGESAAPVPMLTMLVTNPTHTFRRSVLQGRAVQTDFRLDGQMREKNLIDPGLRVTFAVNDPFHLLPRNHAIKHTLLTLAGGSDLIDITAGFGAVQSGVYRAVQGSETLEISSGDAATELFKFSRRDHLKAVERLVITPSSQREKDAEDQGKFQVVELMLTLGDWRTNVLVPFIEEAADRLTPDQWRGGLVKLPGVSEPLQFQLGNTLHALPARLALKDFQLLPYPGGAVNAPGTLYRDFISTVLVTDEATGDTNVETARMNHPIYFRGGDWLFFQSTFDSSPDHAWTGLGVGNRPARGVMWTGFVMIIIGLGYAFYVKPIIIRRMKANAIEAAASKRPKAGHTASAFTS